MILEVEYKLRHVNFKANTYDNIKSETITAQFIINADIEIFSFHVI